MSGSVISRLSQSVSNTRFPSLATLISAVGILGYRGWESRNVLMPLDVVFVQQALDPSSPFSGINTPFGQFDLLRQFSGYLHTVVRLLVELFGLAPLSAFPMLTFVVATAIWTTCSWSIYIAVRSQTNAAVGFVSAMILCLLPSSNIILLGQLNALQWPMLVSCVVLIATGWHPRSRIGHLGFLTLLFLTSASAALAFLPILLLMTRSVIAGWRKYRWPIAAMIVPYAAQIVAYLRQPGRRAEDINPLSQLLREISYIPKTLLPGSIRGSVDESLSGTALLVFWVILVAFLFVLTGSAWMMYQAREQRVQVILLLLVVSLVSGSISVVMNGNLNHQYLMIPMTTFWVATILCVHFLLSTPAKRHIGQAATIFAFGVFVFSSSSTWKSDYSDDFFALPALARLGPSLDRAQAACNTDPTAVVDVSGTGLTLPCEIVLTLR